MSGWHDRHNERAGRLTRESPGAFAIPAPTTGAGAGQGQGSLWTLEPAGSCRPVAKPRTRGQGQAPAACENVVARDEQAAFSVSKTPDIGQ